MIELEFVRWATFAILGGFVWFLKRTITDNEAEISRLTHEVNGIKLNYLHRDDFREFKEELRNMFDRLREDIKEIKHEKG